MSEDKTYNGWTNWETWLVNLWFGDSLHSYVEEDGVDDHDALKSYIREYIDVEFEEKAGFISDLINGFMSEVNWRELLDHYKD